MAKGGPREGAGRRTGSRNKKTLVQEAERKAFVQLALENLRPIFRKQLLLAMGQTFVYRKEYHGKGATLRIEHVLLEKPHEIADALDTIANNDFQDPEGEYVYISTKSPENRALDSILDRSIGKPATPISGVKGEPLEVVTVIQYAKPEGK